MSTQRNEQPDKLVSTEEVPDTCVQCGDPVRPGSEECHECGGALCSGCGESCSECTEWTCTDCLETDTVDTMCLCCA